MVKMVVTSSKFHWVDYLVFVLTLLVAIGIGLFYTWKDRKKKTTINFLLGNRKMGIFPVAMSIIATVINGPFVMGIPAEIYYNGTMYYYTSVSNLFSLPFIVHFIVPVYHKLGIASVYEYLELRFNRTVRLLGCMLFHLWMILSMATTLYAPALALNQVMDIDLWISIVLVGCVCIIYTSTGGLKAVMWADAFQTLIIFTAIVVLIVKTSFEVGGGSYVFQKALDDGKLRMDNFDPSPFQRHTFWTLLIGAFFLQMTGYVPNQTIVQRFISTKNVRKAQIATYMQIPATFICVGLLVYVGLILHVKYGDANPVPCTIKKPDQLLPYLVMDVLGSVHGLPGLLVACIFSATLSSVSSGLNALALVVVVDIIKPVYSRAKGRNMDESFATNLSKVFSIIYGLTIVGLAYAAQYFGPFILQITLSIMGVFGGPLLGLYFMGFFFPCVNSVGAIVSIIVSLLFSTFLAIGSVVNAVAPPVASCFNNITSLVSSTPALMRHNVTDNILISGQVEKSWLDVFFSISYLYYSPLAIIVTLCVGLVVSCFTGGTKRNPVNRNLLSPLYHKIVSISNVTTDRQKKMHELNQTLHVNGSSNLSLRL